LGFETAEVSLLGDREENQDRYGVLTASDATLLVVLDGMGGHAGGARAAEAALESLRWSFASTGPDTDPTEFLRKALAQAHQDVVAIGDELPVGARPRATCAAGFVRDGQASWAHVGDARVYHLRDGAVLERTRDHTPVEQLLQDGLITEDEVLGHPMRHYVEFCLGGLTELPEIRVAAPRALESGDILLVCSDGLWSGVSEPELAASSGDVPVLAGWLARLAARAVRKTTPYSDNTTAVALRPRED
jgi:serine/threonine protein phosphatase PrpC